MDSKQLLETTRTLDGRQLLAQSNGRAVFVAANSNPNTLNAFRLLLTVRDRYDLEDFVVAVPTGSLEAANWIVRCKQKELSLIRVRSAFDDKQLPRLVTPNGDDTRIEDTLSPYFASMYYDHAKKD